MTRIGIGHPITLLAVSALACLVVLVILACNAWAGDVPLGADIGVHMMLSANQPAENVRDVGLSIGYRPTFVNDDGYEEYSRLLFVLGGNYGSGTGDLKVLARFASWWGVDWYAGPGIMAIEEAGTYSLGPIGEFRIETYTGSNPVQLSCGSGHVWRNATKDNPHPNSVPLWVKIGFRTQ